MIGTLILAAGASTRMGRAKQNLLYKGQTLLQTSVNNALQCGCNVAVVLGANAAQIRPTLSASLSANHVFINDDWDEGIGTSIAYGLKQFLSIYPDLENVIFLLADQPFVSTNDIKKLIERHEPGKIVASEYNNTLGPPVLFDKAYFGELLEFKGNEGAKKIINKYKKQVITIPFAAGALDIDTPQDYEQLPKND